MPPYRRGQARRDRARHSHRSAPKRSTIRATQTVVNGSAGSYTWSQPEQGSSYKNVVIYLSGYTNASTSAIVFTTAFTQTPIIMANGTSLSHFYHLGVRCNHSGRDHPDRIPDPGRLLMSITVAGYIPRSGQTAAFLIKTVAVPPVPVCPTSIAGVPVIYQNGVPITPLAHMITSIATTAAGSGYTANNVVTATVTDRQGAGATATTTIAAGHTTITAGWVMTCSGWGFQWGDTCTVTITGGSGSGATATATIGPYWSVTSRDCPFVFYPLPSALSPSDVITFDMPAGTIVTASGSNTAITSQSITNCTGGVEPDCIPASQTLKLGMGMSGQQSQSLANGTDVANWLTKMDMAWTNAVLTYDGWPTYLNAGTTQTRIANTNSPNECRRQGDSDASGNLDVRRNRIGAGHADVGHAEKFRKQRNITGPTITGTGAGKTWVWTAVLPGGATTLNMDLGLYSRRIAEPLARIHWSMERRPSTPPTMPATSWRSIRNPLPRAARKY